jgi:hypothetical protein
MGKEIFISHASADEPLIGGFVEFLRLGLDIERKEIYCITYNKDEIPSGESFTDHIKNNIQESKLVILFLTPNFLESAFCLAEIGAAWALDKKIIPIIVPPLTYDSLERTPLKARQAIKLESLDLIAEEFKNNGYNFSIRLFNDYGEKFKKSLKRLLKKVESPKRVEYEQYEMLQTEMATLIEKSKKDQKKIDELEGYCKELENAKDLTEIIKVKKSRMDAWEQLEELIEEAKDRLRPLQKEIVSALFYEIKGESFRPNPQIDGDIWHEIDVLKQEDKLFVDEDSFEVSANTDYPDIEDAYDKLSELNDFINEASYSNPDLQKMFKVQYRMPLSFNSNFYKDLLEKKIYASR